MYNNFSSKKTKKVISALLASALVVTSAPITANAATAKVVGVGKTFAIKKLKKSAKVSGLTKAEKKIVKVTINKKKRTATVKGLKAGKATFKIGKKAYTVKVGATKIAKKTLKTTMTAGTSQTVSVTATGGKGDTIKFASSNKAVLTVNKTSAKASTKGIAKMGIKAVKEGTAKLTVSSKNTGVKKSFTIKVTAAQPAPTQAPTVVSTPGITTPTATVAATKAPSVVTTPGVTAPGTTDAAQTPSADATQTPGTDATQVPGTTDAASTDAPSTEAPSAEATATPEVPTGGAIETPAPEEDVKAALKDAYKVSDTKVQVNFSNKIAAPTAENFAIEGLTISAAEITEDQKSVVLTVSEMELDKTYTVTVKNIVDAKGEAVAGASVDFVARKITYVAKIEMVDVKTGESRTELKSNGQDTAKVIVTLLDDAGNVIKDDAEVQFTTTAGNFAEKKVAVQNGVATNLFTSEISASKKEAYITATVVSSANKDLLNITASRTISMNPAATTEKDETVGAALTDAMVETCDRVILYFNKDVTATDYTKNEQTTKEIYKYDASKMEITIADNAGTATTVADAISNGSNSITPIALAPVPDETKALYAILPEGTALTDNSKVVVQVTDKTKSLEVKETKSAYVTDIRTPSMLSVTNKGLTKIIVTFSEPIQKGALTNSAEKLEKWVIDNTSLKNDKYGKTTPAKAEVGSFNMETGKDTRNVVTITLGTDEDGDQIYFKAGNHSVQGNNIGDWANKTDTQNNLINTQTLDFVIEADETAPTATVNVESPEQFDVKFNTPVSVSDLSTNLKLQYYKDGAWVDVPGSPVTTIREVDDSDQQEYIVELKKDWTKVLDTATSNKNYYNYSFRLSLAKDKITNVLNGLKNAEINLNLDSDIMKNPDVTSPEMSGVFADGEKYVIIDMSEPVQIALKENGVLNRTLTPTTEQGTTLATPTVQFISSDNSKTINGKIVKISEHDNQINVEPAETLTAGTWKVVVRNVSDDVGNTATTLVKDDFVIEGDAVVAETGFMALWAVAVPAGNDNPITKDIDENGVSNDDVIYVKFNKKIKTYGGAANAGATTNYTVNGYSVPSTSKIESSVTGYNEKANLKNSYNDLVAIHLPKGTLTGDSHQLNISQTIESAAGAKLSNGGLKLLTALAPDGYGKVNFSWNYLPYQKTTATNLTTAELQALLDDGSYSKYVFDSYVTISDASTVDQKYTITHTSDVDFNGKSVKELVVKTNETGVLNISNIAGVEKMTIDAPNADVKLNNVPVHKTDSSATLEVVNILDGTLTINSAVDKLEVTDPDGGAIALGASANITAMTIDTAGKIALDVDGSATIPASIDVKQACTLKVDSAKAITFAVAADVKAEDMKVTSSNGNVSVTGADGTVEVKEPTADDYIASAVKDFEAIYVKDHTKDIETAFTDANGVGVTITGGSKNTASEITWNADGKLAVTGANESSNYYSVAFSKGDGDTVTKYYSVTATAANTFTIADVTTAVEGAQTKLDKTTIADPSVGSYSNEATITYDTPEGYEIDKSASVDNSVLASDGSKLAENVNSEVGAKDTLTVTYTSSTYGDLVKRVIVYDAETTGDGSTSGVTFKVTSDTAAPEEEATE